MANWQHCLGAKNYQIQFMFWLRVSPLLPAFLCWEAVQNFTQLCHRFTTSPLPPATGQFATHHQSQLLLSRECCYIRWACAHWDELWIKLGSWSESPSNANWEIQLSSCTLTVKKRKGFIFLFLSNFWFGFLAEFFLCSHLALGSTSPNSNNEIPSRDQRLGSLFPCRAWIWYESSWDH